jgi:hypothetical protein
LTLNASGIAMQVARLSIRHVSLQLSCRGTCRLMTSTAATAYHRANTSLYGYFLLILAWAPLPLASNRDWSTELLAHLLLAGLAVALALLVTGQLRLTPALRHAWPAIGALVAVQLWVALQLELGISVAPESTRMALLLGCGLVAAFLLVLLLVDSRERVVPGLLCRRDDDERC